MPAPLLELKNIGKIYVSEGNVAVGIRGVNLSFDRGEFVAVTGKSGSGKSTLLNVISGMDTYEEGELYIEGEPTSHYMQKDWEEYRKQYISFIFQEYNIIESFTVLQNVELALMNIDDPKERRRKALELLDRVGLTKFIHHKGSKLSGGQKQRTVIARALAKDSPIILADEPTGNLDSQTSAEIIELLREVSKDKLVIVVTHNFDQVEACATRHIRVFDGAVESDQTMVPTAPPVTPLNLFDRQEKDDSGKKRGSTLRNGLALGSVRFRATPKLSVFLCVLMTLTALALALISSFSADALGIFDKNYMFTSINGRVILARTDGAVITDAELEKLAADMGAKEAVHYDYMLDRTYGLVLGENYDYYRFRFGYPATDVPLDGGRYPEKDNEVVLSVPVSLRDDFGTGNDFCETRIENMFEMADYTVVGVHYYYDNTKDPVMYFTESGYKIATALEFFLENRWNFSTEAKLSLNGQQIYGAIMQGDGIRVDFDMEPGTYTLSAFAMKSLIDQTVDLSKVTANVTLSGVFQDYYYGGGMMYDDGYGRYDYAVEIAPGYGEKDKVTATLDAFRLVTSMTDAAKQKWQQEGGYTEALYMAPDVLVNFMYEQYYTKSYTQATLFFDNDFVASAKLDDLRTKGYTAVLSNETVEQDVIERLLMIIEFGFQALGWVLSVVFLTVFLSLCSSRSMNATKGDVAIMRSMGIPTSVIKISTYVQTLISLIPAVLVTGIVCTVIFMLPTTNAIFHFMHARDYLLLAVLLVAVAVNLARKYVHKMFHDSVKKTLKGGNKS